MLILLLAFGCSNVGRIGECQYRDERVDEDEVGPQGVSAAEMTAMVGTRTFEVEPDDGYGAEWSASLAQHSPFTLSGEAAGEPPFVRHWMEGGACYFSDADPSYLHALVDAHLTSADGAFDVAGEFYVSSVGDGDEGIVWTWDGDYLGLQGRVPGWVEDDAAAEHVEHCPDARADETTWVSLRDPITAPGLSVTIRYREQGVCGYVALLAIGDLVSPQAPVAGED